MHKPQKKHNEIRGYVKRVFYARAVTPLYPRKKSRGLINLCFYVVYKISRPRAGIFTIGCIFTIGRILPRAGIFTVDRHFYRRSAFTVGRHFYHRSHLP